MCIEFIWIKENFELRPFSPIKIRTWIEALIERIQNFQATLTSYKTKSLYLLISQSAILFLSVSIKVFKLFENYLGKIGT